MRAIALRLPTFLFAFGALAGCLGAIESDVGQSGAGLSREGADRDLREGDRLLDEDRFDRCTRDWECRPGDFCLAPDGLDRGDRPDVRFCGREPDYACDSDRECDRGSICERGNCVRLREDKDECRNAREFRAIAARIRNAVADGTMRPDVARQLWRRLASAVSDRCDPVREDDGTRREADDGSRDDGERDAR